jgi:hypothetical protein
MAAKRKRIRNDDPYMNAATVPGKRDLGSGKI